MVEEILSEILSEIVVEVVLVKIINDVIVGHNPIKVSKQGININSNQVFGPVNSLEIQYGK